MVVQERVLIADSNGSSAHALLAPVIASSAPEIERERRLPAALVDAMAAAGLFRMLVPASLGGPECNLITFSEVLQVIARADGSTGWCLGQGGAAPWSRAACGVERQRRFRRHARDHRRGPGSSTAVAEDGGFRLKRPLAIRQRRASCHLDGWYGAIIRRDGRPRLNV